MSITEDLIDIIDKLTSKYDPTPVNVSKDSPLRWESKIFVEDYDFSKNYLELDKNFESKKGIYLNSVASAIEIVIFENGGFEYWDGAYMIESHTWCSKINVNENYPSYSLINKKFKTYKELKQFLLNNI